MRALAFAVSRPAPRPSIAVPVAEPPIGQLPDAVDFADLRRYVEALELDLEHATPRLPGEAPTIRHEVELPAQLAQTEAARQQIVDVALGHGPTDGPTATVIIPVYGNVELTRGCLRSLAAHEPKRTRADYLVIDDASPFDVAGVFTRVEGLSVMRNASNLGFLRTCNRAARLSDADYVVFLNNDTTVSDGWLDALVDVAERDASVGIVGAKLVYPDGTLQEAGGIVWRDASGWNYGRNRLPDDPSYQFLREVDYCSGAALLVRRSLFERLGRFDERFAPAYYEDTDLCFAARRSGFRVMYEPRSVVIHREGGTGGTDVGSSVKRHQTLNQPKFREKWRAVLDTEHFPPDTSTVQRAARRLQGGRTLVMVDNYVPEPDRDSGSNKTARLIGLFRELGWHVIFVPDNDLASQPYTERLQQRGVEVVYATPDGDSRELRTRNALEIADAVWIARPDVFARYRDFLSEYPALPVVYDTVDLHYVRMARELELRNSEDEEEWNEQRRIKEEELAIGREVDVIVAITDIEREILESEGLNNVRVVPNIHVPVGADRPYDRRLGLLFIGGYSHPPNVDAVEWLVNEIMPRVWDEVPDLTLTLLGSNPPECVRALAHDARVAVPGYVENVAPYFESARVFVAPLRFGAGLKGKIGQSLEFALPVVTTSIGAEGFGFADGSDALIADHAADFARAVLSLNRDRDLWQRLQSSGQAKLAPFLPDRVKPRLAEVLADAASRRRARFETAAV